MNVFPQIIVGTYEEFVLGYNAKYDDEKKKKINMQQTFATHSHQASVRCVATHKNLMASSGADEYINIYDMVAMEISTVINYHDSTVTCLEFTPDGSHLVSANQNGDIAIFQCRDWTLVKLWQKAHKHACGVTSMSVHPTGSLLLTTGADNIIRFWNLVKGRQAYATNFSKKCSVENSLNFATWNKKGNFYAVCIGTKVEIYRTVTAAILYEINTKSKITSSAFTKKNLFCLGAEDGSIEVHSLPQKCLILREEAHRMRIKSLASFDMKFFKNEKMKLQNYLITGDSKGGIKLWYLKKNGLNYSLLLKSETNCDCRITCLAMVEPDIVKEEKNESNDYIKRDETAQNKSSNKTNNNTHSEEQNKKKIINNGNSKTQSVAKSIDSANGFKITDKSEVRNLIKKNKRKLSEQISDSEKASKKFKQKKLK